MIAAFLVGAGVGLLVGAGLGAFVIGLLANARVEAATVSEMEASRLAVEALTKAAELQERCDRYVGELDAAAARWPQRDELDALVEATREDDPRAAAHRAWTRTAAPRFDPNPTILLAPGQTYEQWYAAYADRLDREQPGWWDYVPAGAAPQLLALAFERRQETYAQNELDHDRIPTREGFAARRAPFGMAIYPRNAPWEGK